MHLDSYQLMGYTRRRKRKKKHEWPDWISKSLEILKPPDNLTVSAWSDKNRILDETSAEPGPWRTTRTPYLRSIMDAFNDPEIEVIIFVKPTQVGGTASLENMIGYIIAQDPSPTMIVYPKVDLAEHVSKNRFRKMIELCKVLVERYKEDISKILELQFDGMYMVLSGANSASSLASYPIRFLLMDEIDKYPASAGKEADPISLAEERTKNFPHNKKIYKTSTPTRKNGPIWKEWENADNKLRYYMPCPHCGHTQTFKFKQIKWPKEAKTAKEASESAYYECEHCKGIIHDYHKPTMLSEGEWRSEKKTGTRKTAFHLNAIYSPWLKFGDVVYKFLTSKDDPMLLMNFVNSWLAEPWENTEVKMNSDIVLKRQSGVAEGIVPIGSILLTGGVDVQKDYFYYTIRAWGERLTSWNIAHGRADTWDDIETIMNSVFYDERENPFQINLCAIDSGARTDEVYEFCAINQEWAVPMKGSSTPLLSRYKISTIDKSDSKAYGMRLYIVDGGQYKDMIAGRLKRENGYGSWMVHDKCDMDYAEQICSEEKTIEKKGGRDVEVWRPKASHIANHYLDCEVYAACAADLLNIRYLQGQQEEENIQQPKANPAEESGGFIKSNGNWINQKGGWIK